MNALRRWIAPLAITVGMLAPSGHEVAFADDAPTAQARPARPTRASGKTKAKKKTKAKPKKAKKLRADRGQVSPDRVPANAKVATGDQKRASSKGKKGRVDPSSLPLAEQTALKIEEVMRGPLREGTTSIFVADAETGKPVFSVYPDDPLNPASNVKLVSTAAALDIMGPDFQYVTRLLGEAPDDAGVIAHDLYLLGSYDPTLSKTSLGALAQSLIADGTRVIAGDIVVGSTPTRDGIYRSWGEVTVVAGPAGSAPAVSITSPSDFIVVEVTAESSSKKKVKKKDGIKVKSELFTDEAGHQRMKITVSGAVARGKTVVREIFVKERAQHAAHVLRGILRDAGVEVLGDVHIAELGDYVDASLGFGFLPLPLAEHRSQRFADIVMRVNKRSTNWLADRLIMTAAALKYRTKPGKDVANDAMYAWLKKHTGLERGEIVIDGGSGLSYKTEFSARQVVTVLRAGMGLEGVTASDDAAVQQAYRDSLAIGGKDGTIKHRFKALRGSVHGKTGTLHRVVALAGTLEAKGRTLVFSMISNGHDPKWKKRVRGGQEQLVGFLCDYLHKLPALPGSQPTAGEPVIDAEPTLDPGTEPVVGDVEEGESEETEGEIEIEAESAE